MSSFVASVIWIRPVVPFGKIVTRKQAQTTPPVSTPPPTQDPPDDGYYG